MLLARVPVALEEPRYFGAVVLASIGGAFFAEAANRVRSSLVAVDALALGLFSVIGAQSALHADLPVASPILMGTSDTEDERGRQAPSDLRDRPVPNTDEGARP